MGRFFGLADYDSACKHIRTKGIGKVIAVRLNRKGNRQPKAYLVAWNRVQNSYSAEEICANPLDIRTFGVLQEDAHLMLIGFTQTLLATQVLISATQIQNFLDQFFGLLRLRQQFGARTFRFINGKHYGYFASGNSLFNIQGPSSFRNPPMAVSLDGVMAPPMDENGEESPNGFLQRLWAWCGRGH